MYNYLLKKNLKCENGNLKVIQLSTQLFTLFIKYLLPFNKQDYHLSSMVGKVLSVCLGFYISLENKENINGEGLKLLTYTRHSWPFNSEDSLACQARHTCCDTGNSVYIVHLQGHVTFTPLGVPCV